MPQRFLKPGITNSERWNSVSWKSQSLYIRILTVVDDYGRYDGRSAVIHGICLSIYNATHPDAPVELQETDKMLQELAAHKLVELYEAEGKIVVQLTQWTERIREGSKEKWPSIKNGKLLQFPADSCGKLPPSSPPPPPPSSPTTPPPPPSSTDDMAVELPERFPKTVEEAKNMASMLNIPEEIVVHAWNKAMSRGGRDANDIPIRSFLGYLQTERKYDLDRKGKEKLSSNGNGNLPNGAQMVIKGDELKRAELKMASIRNQYGDHQSWTKEDRDEFNRLKVIRDENRKLLGVRA